MAQSRPSFISSYAHASRQPLQILCFLLPLIAIFEIGLMVILRGDDGIVTIRAHEALITFFGFFDIPVTQALFLGGFVVIAILLVWHHQAQESWRVRWPVIAGIAVESLLWTAPLLVFGSVLAQPLAAGAEMAVMDGQTRFLIAIGAGLYEELLFRLVLIGGIHMVLSDLLRWGDTVALSIAVILSAAAFTWYHDLAGLTPTQVAFYAIAGIYLSLLFLWRGFGVAVGTHVTYNVVVAAAMA
jgi:membrane protease YdiL (CAAX protease family)